MTKEEFISEIWENVKTCPKCWRKGQAVFNVIEERYGEVAREVQFIDKVDCFYVDEDIDTFIDCVWERISNKK